MKTIKYILGQIHEINWKFDSYTESQQLKISITLFVIDLIFSFSVSQFFNNKDLILFCFTFGLLLLGVSIRFSYIADILDRYKSDKIKCIENTESNIEELDKFCRNGVNDIDKFKNLLDITYSNMINIYGEKESNEKISKFFSSAICFNNLNIVQYFIFDWNIQIPKELRNWIKIHYIEVEKYLELRQLNRDLPYELERKENEPLKKRIKV